MLRGACPRVRRRMKIVAERRRPGQRQHQRGQQRHAHRDRQGAEEHAGDAR